MIRCNVMGGVMLTRSEFEISPTRYSTQSELMGVRRKGLWGRNVANKVMEVRACKSCRVLVVN
eukprot:scaffold846_cov168-Amphora_coffeaeformis.AAC.10